MLASGKQVQPSRRKVSHFGLDLLRPIWRPKTPDQLQVIRRRMERLSIALEREYGTPDLGNLANPLDEAIYIITTYQTDLERAAKVWADLKERFPRWEQVLDASVVDLQRLLKPGGFHRIRAKLIRRLLLTVRSRWGELSLNALGNMTSKAAEVELRALPGLDIKGARCVLMYSLRRAVLPIDSNAFRFMQRYGVILSNARYRRLATHNEIQELVPASQRYRLHVNLVVHGQSTCMPRNPRCYSCPVQRTCAKTIKIKNSKG